MSWPSLVAPAAALLALYLAAAPAFTRAWAAASGLTLSLRDLPRPPRAPALAVPPPPALPAPPRPPGARVLWDAFKKEMQP